MKNASLLLLIVAVFTVSCKDNSQNQEETNQEIQMEDEAMKESNNEEVNLDNWKAYNSDEITQWSVEDGAIVLNPSQEEGAGSQNLISKEKYTNFELSLEWKISEGGNSGIMWGVQEDPKFNEPYLTGPEIQILDNEKHPDGKNGPIRHSGALYDMVEPSTDASKPVGEWNETVIRIDYNENKGSITLNGTTVTEFPLEGEEWEKLVENSKFKEWEDFGKYKTGHIALQDHNDKVWFRNIKIKELE